MREQNPDGLAVAYSSTCVVLTAPGAGGFPFAPLSRRDFLA